MTGIKPYDWSARIVDLEAQVATLTRQRDAARELLRDAAACWLEHDRREQWERKRDALLAELDAEKEPQ